MTGSGPRGQPTPEKQALLAAYEQVLKSEAERRTQAGSQRPARPKGAGAARRRMHLVTVLALIVLAAVGAHLAIVKPAWVFGATMPPQTAAVTEASLRLALSLQRQRIERFRAAESRLPFALEEAGAVVEGIEYELTPDGYELVAMHESRRLTLRSGDSIEEFLGDSYEVIQQRGRP